MIYYHSIFVLGLLHHWFVTKNKSWNLSLNGICCFLPPGEYYWCHIYHLSTKCGLCCSNKCLQFIETSKLLFLSKERIKYHFYKSWLFSILWLYYISRSWYIYIYIILYILYYISSADVFRRPQHTRIVSTRLTFKA